MLCETLGALRTALAAIEHLPDDVKLTHTSDHAGVSIMYTGVSLDTDLRGIRKSKFGGWYPVPLDDPEKEFDAIKVG